MLEKFFKKKESPDQIFSKEESKTLIKFLGRLGIRELKSFLKSNEPETVMNNFNHKKIHLLNENEDTMEPHEIKELNTFTQILSSNNLTICYYDNGIGADSLLCISKEN